MAARGRGSISRASRAPILEGTVLLDELLTRRLPLEQINEGFEEMERGALTRAVVVFS
jgi:S-(hydroxymethyl)glutathione dehydrogenase/alcohol dehydrogenase